MTRGDILAPSKFQLLLLPPVNLSQAGCLVSLLDFSLGFDKTAYHESGVQEW